MARAFKYYAILVMVVVGLFPTIFFISGSYEVENKTAPDSYSGKYHFFKSHDGLELFARIHESDPGKPYLLYLEDFPASNNYITELELNDSLSNSFNMIYLDYRGTGKSERFKNPYNFALNHLVYDVENLRKSLNLEKLTVIGHGMGALIAQYYSIQFPNTVEKLYLVSPIANYDKSAKQAAGDLAQFYAANKELPPEKSAHFEMEGYSIDNDIGFFAISKIMGHFDLHKRWYYDSLNVSKRDHKRVIDSDLYTEADVLSVHYQLINVGLLFSEFKRPHYDAFTELKVPTTAIFGKEDKFSGGILSNLIDSLNPVIEQVFIDSAKYYPHIENKLAFLSYIK